jgi:hypothetical protein
LELENAMSHTPGPWRYEDDELGFEVISYSGTICQIESCDEKDDARLIAAAPEMLEALKRVAESNPSIELFDLCSAVIRKAEEGR